MPWQAKAATYEAAAGCPSCARPSSGAGLTSHHYVYGQLEPEPALGLLDRLELPAGAGHEATLRRVPAAGHRRHSPSPEAWGSEAAPGG
ncbi:hypothetical protein AB0F11_30235 [Streptomyces sp. NPDC032472]|uniref:hypothetical protein n=1 Tax=Streptomyces sp. NPDC032472 TaxID=3155018 RepID=UPI0033D398DB